MAGARQARAFGGGLLGAGRDLLFTYETQKRLRLDVPLIGISFRALQGMIFFWLGLTMLLEGDHLLFKEVVGSVNPYANSNPGTPSTTRSYCSSGAYQYKYDDDFQYLSPACRIVDVYEVNQKRKNFISFSTVYIDFQYFQWPAPSGACLSSATAAASAATAAGCTASTVTVSGGGGPAWSG